MLECISKKFKSIKSDLYLKFRNSGEKQAKQLLKNWLDSKTWADDMGDKMKLPKVKISKIKPIELVEEFHEMGFLSMGDPDKGMKKIYGLIESQTHYGRDFRNDTGSVCRRLHERESDRNT